MKEKTALMQLIEKLKKTNEELNTEDRAQYSYSCALNFAIGECLELLPIEEHLIIDAFKEGFSTDLFDTETTPQQYYDNKYKN